MTRYFFNFYTQSDECLDPEGLELPDAGALATAVLNAARDMIAADAMAGRIDLHCRIEAVNEAQDIIHSLSFADAVTFVAPLPTRLAA